MKNLKNISFFIIIIAILGFSLTSCGKDEPETPTVTEPTEPTEPAYDQFEDLYGYWLNADKSGAMNIVKDSEQSCKILYYVYMPAYMFDYYIKEDYYAGTSFSVLGPYNQSFSGCRFIRVKISSNSYNKIVLNNYGDGYNLSSYIFSRVSEDEFYNYLENGDEDFELASSMLIGTWLVNSYKGKGTITFNADGTVKEVINSNTTTGKYSYSNGKITNYMDGKSTILNDLVGRLPWKVTFPYSNDDMHFMSVYTNDGSMWSFDRE